MKNAQTPCTVAGAAACLPTSVIHPAGAEVDQCASIGSEK